MGRHSGAVLIMNERRRQTLREGWSHDHDDEVNADGQLIRAAISYSLHARATLRGRSIGEGHPWLAWWPWETRWWKPSPTDPIRDLVKAGALIAAEIDRLQRAADDKVPF